jgi:carboxyl-terminal processing protease
MSLLLGACANSIVGADKPASGALVFDQLWTQVDLHYSYFDLKHINWDSLRTAYRPRAASAADSNALAKVLGQMLAELRDPHVALTPFGAGSTMRFLGRSDTARTFFSAMGVHDAYMPAQDFNSKDVVRASMIGDGIGYVHIANFHGAGWASKIDSALRALPAAQALILDVRDNAGGTYALAVDIAGRFVQQRRVFGFLRFRNGASHSSFTEPVPEAVTPSGLRQFRGPIYLLTNRRTVSSGEVFVLALRTNPRVVVIGDTTAGASGGPTARELPNGWILELSEWMEYTPDYRTYEGIGLAPDVVVKPVASDFARHVDPALERALLLAAAAATVAEPLKKSAHIPIANNSTELVRVERKIR